MVKIAKIDRQDKIGRKKDGISKSRKTGFTKFSYQPTRVSWVKVMFLTKRKKYEEKNRRV
ncbi:hypothetical protein [Plasmodium yoelii yoelii]|uniref:Uncharacterized protein n=1 Tax=Plasmodium yoelii yoelii TaxID=73239 RepID=Q7RRL7_PLAYO|nr:hypothetical protein [Plasmodium yoelii yoelii]